MQAHWNIYGPSIEEIRSALELYASFGAQNPDYGAGYLHVP
ncbi:MULTISPECIES: hypothetical protein [unclassified Paenibacillus]|nr:hypothetical protein [Paenibacillus sp. FSL H8-0259]